MTVSQPSPYPSAGEIIDGKYKIEKLLGEGGMGAVARATHVVLGGAVALKFMHPQFMSYPGAVERFVNEGRASKAIRSEHVLPVLDVGLLPNGAPYLMMECLQGCDLSQLLEREGPTGLPVDRALNFVVQILRGLQAAHAINIIHRDMKPSNCFVVTHEGEHDFVKILDFGISKVTQPGSSSLTQTNTALGTPLYMSPEQARSSREVDARTDIYAVGVIFYELLSGRTPFSSETGEFTEILFKLFTSDPPPIRTWCPGLAPELAAVVHKALARDVAARFSSVLAMAEALSPFATGRAADRIDRMRGFVPPSLSSGRPHGLPTSMAALSQLQRVRESEVMRAAPETLRAPLEETAVHGSKAASARVLQAHTALLDPSDRGGASSPQPANAADDKAPSGHVSVPALESARALPEEALNRTQALPPPESRRPPTPFNVAVEPAPHVPRRSPLLVVLPVLALTGLVGLGVAFTLFKKSDTPAANSASRGSTASASPIHVETMPTAASVVATPSASPVASASASTAASSQVAASTSLPRKALEKPVPRGAPTAAERPSGRYDPGLDTKIKME